MQNFERKMSFIIKKLYVRMFNSQNTKMKHNSLNSKYSCKPRAEALINVYTGVQGSNRFHF